ncbi:MAG: hypothetical protein ACO23F_05740 [Candidatus Limnocylindrus sp.]
MDTTTIRKIATAKAVSDKDYKSASEQLGSGIYTVDTTIRLIGTLKKGEPYKTSVAAAVNPWKLLRAALSKLNNATIESLVRESLEGNDEETAAVKGAAERALAELVASTERTVSGRITGHVKWEVLS